MSGNPQLDVRVGRTVFFRSWTLQRDEHVDRARPPMVANPTATAKTPMNLTTFTTSLDGASLKFLNWTWTLPEKLRSVGRGHKRQCTTS